MRRPEAVAAWRKRVTNAGALPKGREDRIFNLAEGGHHLPWDGQGPLPVTALFGEAGGTLRSVRLPDQTFWGGTVAVADFDGDGNDDFAGPIIALSEIYVLLGSGDGNFG